MRCSRSYPLGVVALVIGTTLVSGVAKASTPRAASIDFAGCVSASGTGGACAKGTALVGPRSVGLSPDGKNLYFPATTAAAVAIFARNQTTGALKQLVGTSGCISESGTNGACAIGRALAGARS